MFVRRKYRLTVLDIDKNVNLLFHFLINSEMLLSYTWGTHVSMKPQLSLSYYCTFADTLATKVETAKVNVKPTMNMYIRYNIYHGCK